MPQQQKLKGGRKLRRSPKHKNMYIRQRERTAKHKLDRQRRRNARRDHWRLLGVKKNGQKVAK